MLKFRNLKPKDVKKLFLTSSITSRDTEDAIVTVAPERPSLKRRRQEGQTMQQELLRWYQTKLEPFRDVVNVRDLSASWRNGLAICAVLTACRPELM